ncbi:cation-efflux pump [Candidatus Roizmanbacteria bacterium CG_4_10_14_0_8_um_filter_33_9]|uniref:Cation-efflux pump n=1 Tax=Candidatus Roizmanbacteria bacterium CG_4_10_14_0_8_um_filter_33_9 TaxID=1974826 RepID=A0A2M7QI36_9BACT|nr:MAG: cation-efflux pump [Candidatus Roizmanbacteria bacterium CG_4_10_14_0_8_um_filter_33_9]
MNKLASQKLALISICALIIVIIVKFASYYISGSVSLLSDAMESFVNLAAATITFFMIRLALQPPDKEHMYGHTKAEYFSSIMEGIFIFFAALAIMYAAIMRILNPQPLQKIEIGLVLSLIASAINYIVAQILINQGKKRRSIALEADGSHLMTDVFTSGGVFIGLIIVSITHIAILDPIIAILVALQIIVTGVKIINKSVSGFMDVAISPNELAIISDEFSKHEKKGIQFHGLLTRQSGTRRFISFHVLVPGDWTIKKGHSLVESIEVHILNHIPFSTVTTHLEPIGDPLSWKDENLDRT